MKKVGGFGSWFKIGFSTCGDADEKVGNAWIGRSANASRGGAGWIVKQEDGRGACSPVAPWVVAEEKQHLFYSLAGFLKKGYGGAP